MPAILTCSSICSVNIQMQDTGAKSGCPQILVLVVYESNILSPSICPILYSPHTLSSQAACTTHTHVHTHMYVPLSHHEADQFDNSCACQTSLQMDKSQRIPAVTSLPLSVRMQFLSGFSSATLSLIHSTPDGITLAVGRPEEDSCLAPAPTSVQIGW